MIKSLVVALCALAYDQPGDSWPAFRGDGTSRSAARNLPRTWNERGNIAWTADLPGYGQSSPVIAEDKAYVTSIEGPNKETLIITAIDVASGQIRWSKRFETSVKIENTGAISKAAPTPVVDAERVYALFGSGDVIAVSLDGEELWHRSLTQDYGQFNARHGIGGSPVLTAGLLVIPIDHDGQSYIVALEKTGGGPRWKTDRESGIAWTTPVIVGEAGARTVLVSGSGSFEGYDAATGERLWRIDGLEGNTSCSPSVDGDLVVIGASGADSNVAYRLNADRTQPPEELWRAEGVTCSFASPLVDAGRVYFVNRVGACVCVNAETGEELWTQRLSGECWASPIVADGNVFFFCTNGEALIARAADRFRQVGVNTLSIPQDESEERVYGVAAVNGAFLIRTGNRLFCAGRPR